jgi:hypothetical protein
MRVIVGLIAPLVRVGFDVQMVATGGIAASTFDASKSSSSCPFPFWASRFDLSRQGSRRAGCNTGWFTCTWGTEITIHVAVGMNNRDYNGTIVPMKHLHIDLIVSVARSINHNCRLGAARHSPVGTGLVARSGCTLLP